MPSNSLHRNAQTVNSAAEGNDIALGKVVLVTGVLDSGSNTIHVKKIEIAS